MEVSVAAIPSFISLEGLVSLSLASVRTYIYGTYSYSLALSIYIGQTGTAPYMVTYTRDETYVREGEERPKTQYHIVPGICINVSHMKCMYKVLKVFVSRAPNALRLQTLC